MINLETRKKLRSLNLFESPDSIQKVQGNYCSSLAEYDLPNPTLEELIDAMDEKTNVKWGVESPKENGSWLVWFKQGGLKSTTQNRDFLTSDGLDDCLATALIWLHEQEE